MFIKYRGSKSFIELESSIVRNPHLISSVFGKVVLRTEPCVLEHLIHLFRYLKMIKKVYLEIDLGNYHH